MQKNKAEFLSFPVYKNQLQNGLKTNIRSATVKFLKEHIKSRFLDVGLSNDFLELTSRKQRQQKYNKKMGQNKLLQTKGRHQQSEKTTY